MTKKLNATAVADIIIKERENLLAADRANDEQLARLQARINSDTAPTTGDLEVYSKRLRQIEKNADVIRGSIQTLHEIQRQVGALIDEEREPIKICTLPLCFIDKSELHFVTPGCLLRHRNTGEEILLKRESYDSVRTFPVDLNPSYQSGEMVYLLARHWSVLTPEEIVADSPM